MLELDSREKTQLLDARIHLERHQDLIVRRYGYSTRFVNLTPEMQEEFIRRNGHGETA